VTDTSKITVSHRERLCLVYIRQSTLAQTRVNTESLERQYELAGLAQRLGWDRSLVRVIDDDLGMSGAEAAGRAGFQDLVAEVALGRVGLIVGLEASRLARSNSLFRYRNKAFCSAYGFMPRRDREFLPRW
jgi:DNA invertase Pin-like site-specific DNA recombinase